MKKKLYSIKDTKAGVYNAPFECPTDTDAIRQFARAVNDPQTTVHMYPSEFELYMIGTYETDNGKIMQTETHYFLSNGQELRQKNSAA